MEIRKGYIKGKFYALKNINKSFKTVLNDNACNKCKMKTDSLPPHHPGCKCDIIGVSNAE